ncbi:DEAD/DEAH box helicase [Bacillus sp. B-jedd]|uniref:DEAD/DEAH box helicase n=1 Tax=Bacillus sp. B-jedd TaxID=1476857 RepID=UPI0005155E7F|nr:DEAD/DEAH box helicase [Bacillus sp. B-jedd]CEG27437.1 helicase [Bacillus sp. B-jedd]
MEEIIIAYDKAINNTKNKIIEDLMRYMETKEKLPSPEDYVEERFSYLEQLWLNVWLNRVTADVPKKVKKDFLQEQGFVTEGIEKKLLNSLFRNEMRQFRPFDAIAWLSDEMPEDHGKWAGMYRQAKKRLKEREEAEKVHSARLELTVTITKLAEEQLQDSELILYLHTRHALAVQLDNDFKNGKRFKWIDPFMLEEKLQESGSFHHADYRRVGEFFNELTGSIHKTLYGGRYFYEYERYFYPYEHLVKQTVLRNASRLITNNLPATLAEQLACDESTQKEGFLSVIIADTADVLAAKFMEEVEGEYVSDLLKLAPIPFDPETHKTIYEGDLAGREIKLAEEKAEAERKAAEEQKMLEDVFGSEYRPAANKAVKYVLHIGETNTGKTHRALSAMKKAQSGIYLAPLRLLALEIYDRLNGEGIPCSLKTGEEEKSAPGASHISCTVEMFHEKDYYEVAVIDEAQMIADKDRGFSWYKAITKANAQEVHIIGSRNIKQMLIQLLGDAKYELIEYTRDEPLRVEDQEFTLKRARKGDALVCFSRRQVLATAAILQSNGHKVSMIYGSMPPETRKKQMQLFQAGETTIIVSTDAIGMGLNLPIRRIVFLENEKFDGTARRWLSSQEIKQIAGRAGRKGIYDQGRVAFVSEIPKMKKLLQAEDQPVDVFAIAPTSSVFERFQKYSRSLGDFFDLWEKYASPPGTRKADLAEERSRYQFIEGTMIETRFPMMELYGYLHLPFSAREPELTEQWLETIAAIADGNELPEPELKNRTLEEMELSYKALGLHLLFLYKLGKRTEAVYWERIREQVSDRVHEQLKDVTKTHGKKCRICKKALGNDHRFPICDECHKTQERNKNHFRKNKKTFGKY